MIRRTRPKGPKELLLPAAEVDRERTEAITFYTATVKSKEGYKFKIYRQQYVKDAIEAIFFKKCAYCETYYASAVPVDVEHFRPKSAVKVGKEKKTGYYWLASEWTNLLPSCVLCNRSKTYPMSNTKKVTMGKMNFFPIEDESKRATKPGEEINEKPLLVHPIDDEPSEHLEFTKDGIVRAALDKKGNPSNRGEISIKIYALSRPELVERRSNHASKILAQIERVKEAEKFMRDYENDPRFEAALRRELAALAEYLEPKQEYSALARTLAENFINEMKARLASA